MKNNFKKLIKELKSLNLPNDKYAIYGSGPMAVRGIRDTSDLDLIVTDQVYEELKKKYKDSFNKNKIEIGNIEIFSLSEFNYSIDNFWEKTELIEGVRFITLDYLIELKKCMGRPKDLRDIELIKKYQNKKI